MRLQGIIIQKKLSRIGFTCSYTPLALIDAAGFTPYRILPVGESPDRAGEVLHDNLCPHVKRVLDRVLYNDVPELEGVILLNSCDPANLYGSGAPFDIPLLDVSR